MLFVGGGTKENVTVEEYFMFIGSAVFRFFIRFLEMSTTLVAGFEKRRGRR